jgi:integrase
MTTLILPPPADAPTPVPGSIDLWLEASATDPRAAAQLRANAETHAETKKGRHARNTIRSYDIWWDRFDRWCRMPSERIRGRALPAATPAMALDPTDTRGMQILLIFLYELVHGPEDPESRTVWDEDFGSVAPSTLAIAVSALKARCSDHLGHGLSLTSEVDDALAGLRRLARAAYGKDRRATPILAEHLRTMLQYLAGGDDPLVARDRLLLELTAGGVTPGEIARLTVDGLLDADHDLSTASHDANALLWEQTGKVAARALVVPGRILGGGRQAPGRIITLLPGHPLTSAIDAWVPHRRGDNDRALIDGTGESNPRSIHRAALKALASDAAQDGCTWTPTRATPVPGDGDLDACRRVLAARAGDDLAMRQRDTVALWIGWRIALRRSELMALTVGDLTLHSDRVQVTIARSKTDQDAKGVTLPVVAGSRTDGLNPLDDIRSWLDTLARVHGFESAADLPASTPLFPALGRGQEVLTRQVTLADGTIEVRRYDQLSGQGWSDRLRLLAERSGAIHDVDALRRVTGHSLRRGYVTSAAIAGRTAVQIRRITRHVDLNSLARYVEEVQLQWDDDPDDFEMLVPDRTEDPTTATPPTTLDGRLRGARIGLAAPVDGSSKLG